MLEKVICVDNVGVLKKGAQRAIDLSKVSLVYADNARGKTTFSSLMLSCSTSDPQEIIQRKTIGATTAQKVVFRFNPPGVSPAFNAEFDGSVWGGGKPNMHIYNQTFVDRNVYASTGVLPEQREALLSLALGDSAVTQKQKFEQQSALQRECAGRVSSAEGALQGYRGGLSVDSFMALQPLPDVEARIAELEKKIGEARAADQIAKRPEFKALMVPDFNLDGISEAVVASFESLSVTAEETVKNHFAKHSGQSTERWASEGMSHLPDKECPFCGQPTTNLDLIGAYRSYFDASYKNHLARIAALRGVVARAVSQERISSWQSAHEFNRGVLGVWAENLSISEPPKLYYEWAAEELGSIQGEILTLVAEKERSPLDPLSPEVLSKAMGRLASVVEKARIYNKEISDLNSKVSEYKSRISSPNIGQLHADHEQLVVRRRRYDPKAVEIVDQVMATRNAYKNAEREKDSARTELDKLMAITLGSFQNAINDWLSKFAAPFQVDQLAPTYRGGGLRSEYVLKVRGATVNVGPGSSGQMSFHSALSEGDKRTLAFAFFLARLFADPNRSGSTVVLDDVFTSLDRHRRHHTIDAVLRMIGECSQVIILAHDAHFLREIKKRVARKRIGECAELALHRDGDDYSYLDKFDLDDYCSSDYYKHYVAVERFVAGDNTVGLLEVAKSLRPLIEGHLHRCFPKKFKEGQTVGDLIEQIKSATGDSPLVRLQPQYSDLMSFNDFASAYHHDTSGGYPRTDVNAAELLPFAKGALGFIQVRSLK